MRTIILLLFLLGLTEAKEYKAIFDCSSNDSYYIMTRMNLIGKTMDMMERSGDKANFVITLHGGCILLASKEYFEIADDNDLAYIQKAQDSIKYLSQKKDVSIIACAIALKANAIEQSEVLPFINISKNSFIDTIDYQNRGYALMPLK